MDNEKNAAEPSGASGGSLAWIPVTERLPPPEVEVLVFSGDYDSGTHVASRDSDGLWFPGVTHWMPLPAPPTSDK